jgi:KUP system potassium uptake protein
VNWALMVGVILLVLGFESSGALASAYGVAVTGTMLCTTILVASVMLLAWKWPPLIAVPILVGCLFVDGLFFAANVPKVVQGGAFPFLAGIALFILMTTWKRGKQLLVERIDEGGLPLPIFISSIRVQPPLAFRARQCFSRRVRTPFPMRCCITCCTTRCCMSRWCC